MTPPPLKIALINMPFAMTCMPSLGMAQLEAVLKLQFGDRVQITTHYLNLEFAHQVGNLDLYHHPYSSHGYMTDAGEWLFGNLAFPDAGNKSSEYLERYYSDNHPDIVEAKAFLIQQQSGLEDFLESLIEKHALLEADIVGFTLLFSQTVASLALARLLKKQKPELITILGGASCEGETGQVLVERVPQIDYCFSGHAMVSLPEFVRCRLEGDLTGCDRINGVFSKTNRALWGDGTQNTLLPLGDELDIDACILPDFTSFLDAHERLFPNPVRKPVLLFETSRGCARAQVKPCRFCGLNGLNTKYRKMTSGHAIKQINTLWHYVPRVMFFMAVDNLMPPGYPESVFSQLSPPKGIAMRYEVRPDLSEKDLESLCRGGVTWFQPGIEALSTSTLKLMNKGGTAFGNLKFLKNCTKFPVTLEWNLLIGTPGESETVYEKYARMIPQMVHLAPPTGVFPIMFVKYSHYYRHQEEYGLTLHPLESYSYIFPFSHEDLQRVACRYSDAKTNQNQLEPWLDRLNALVLHWRERWKGQDGKIPARLCITEDADGASLYDARSGEAIWHSLTTSALALLRLLDKPASLADLQAEFLEKESQIEEILHHFVTQGWVFEEDGLYMSLIEN
jgi:ribosomal peptide maturation radical SAM protein 1